MRFEWNEKKEEINIQKHGIDFRTASLVFGDDNRIEKYDEAHSTYWEDRYITIGISVNTTLTMVVYTERNENVIRIISARLANKKEEVEYYGNSRN
ncbi:MAG: BrnT family toxin [Firmicutes bacterium]|nr:BrnT family toxin [Bacillota bacterium]